MRIIYFAVYFYPEKFSSRTLQTDRIKMLTDAGHSVTVIAPVPSRGISNEDREKTPLKEVIEGAQVIRFKVAKERRNIILRMLRYRKCLRKMRRIALTIKDADLIYCESTPPTIGKMCGKLAKRMKIPFIYNLQDIFPDSLVTTGIIKKPSGFIWEIGRKIEDKTYKLATKIIVISKDFKDNLVAKVVPAEKIELIYNHIDTQKLNYICREKNKLFDELNIPRHKFIISYCGNFGKAQNLELILDSAAMLKDYKDILFVLIGSGVEEQNLKTKALRDNIENVLFFPMQPLDRLEEVYSLADASVVICKKGAGGSAMPSKLLTIMSCSIPVLVNFDPDSELEALIKENCCGIFSEAGNTEAFANSVMELYNNPEKARLFGQNGRCLAENTFDKSISLSKLLSLIENTEYK